MEGDKVDDYKGRKITLLPGQQDNGKWICQFGIVTFGKTEMGSQKHYADGVFDSCQEAKAAALKEAQALIDSH